MIAPVHFTQSPDHLQARFLAILPRIRTHARINFRHVACAETKADLVSETVALTWKWFVRLAHRGKDATQYPSVLATYAAHAVNCGRRVTRMDSAKDVMSPRAQRRHGFAVEFLPPSTRTSYDSIHTPPTGQRSRDEWEERLTDNTVTPPDEQAMFRIDFADWLQSMTARERRIVKAMACNERTKDLSRMFELSAGRISQMRREFRDGWERFGDTSPT